MLHFLATLIRKLLKLVMALVLLICVAALTICGVSGYAVYHEATVNRPLEQAALEVQQKPGYTTLDQVPQIFLNAVVATEDHRFYDHHGFDVIGTGRALVRNALSGELQEGGSTISQQLARTLYYEQTRSLSRKIAELITYSPTVNYDLSRQRQEQVLTRMVDAGYLDEETATAIYNEGI